MGQLAERWGGQKVENAPGRTRGKNKTLVGYNWSQPPLQSDSKRQRAGSSGPKQAGRAKAQSTLQDGFRASKVMSRAHSFCKPSLRTEIDVGWKREIHGKGLFQLLGQEKGDHQDRQSKGPFHSAYLSAKGKAKSGHEDPENQQRDSAMKRGSRKLWNALLPSSSVCRQWDRSRSEPLTTERSTLLSDTLPMEDGFEAGTQLVQGCSEEGMTLTKEHAEQRNFLRAACLSKGKEKMHNIAK